MVDFDPAAQLKTFLRAEPGKHQFSDSTAVHLMVLCRHLLERDNAKDKYQTLNLYCNWTVHTELEGSRVAYRMLSKLSQINALTPERIDEEVSEALSLITLRKELIALLITAGVPTQIFDSIAGWEMFGGHFFKAIVNKRLRWPSDPGNSKRSKDIWDKLNSSNPRTIATSVYITNVHSPALEWVLEISDGTYVRGSLKNLERVEDFGVISYKAEVKATP